ncbi:MAG: glycosyltransferase [Patescibacteria group bacterium]|nr:glycosyltransferase [Patescibacteria group bacterium]
MKVAIVCDYLNVYGGAERTLEAILEIYPQAEVFTSLYDPSKFREGSLIRGTRVRSSPDFRGIIPKIGIIPIFRFILSIFPKHLTFAMPFFFERFDLSGYGLVISLGTIWSKGVRTQPGQKHIFYCLTPPRFLYGYPSETAKRNVWYYRPFTTAIDHALRIWDFNAAQKPSRIVVISQEIQRRVKKFYRRNSVVIYPPVGSIRPRLADSQGEALRKRGEYFLIVSRLAAYKGIDVAIKACNELKLPLKIVGTGREEGRLKAAAGPTVEFLGFRSDEEIDGLYKGAKALIFPTPDEDFGIVPVEANAHGVPVIAHKSGGPLETMVEGRTAVFFKDINELKEALKNFDESKFDPNLCIDNAQRFSKERFQEEFKKFVESLFD